MFSELSAALTASWWRSEWRRASTGHCRVCRAIWTGRVARAVLLARGSPDRRRPRRRPTSGRQCHWCGKLQDLPAGSTPVTCTYFTSHHPSADAHRARSRRDRYTRFCYHYDANGALCPWLRLTWCACRPAGLAHSPLAPGIPPPPRPARPEPRPVRPDRSSWPLHSLPLHNRARSRSLALACWLDVLRRSQRTVSVCTGFIRRAQGCGPLRPSRPTLARRAPWPPTLRHPWTATARHRPHLQLRCIARPRPRPRPPARCGQAAGGGSPGAASVSPSRAAGVVTNMPRPACDGDSAPPAQPARAVAGWKRACA